MKTTLFLCSILGALTSACTVTPNITCTSDCDERRDGCYEECETTCTNASGDLDEACDTDCRTTCDGTHTSCSFTCTGNDAGGN